MAATASFAQSTVTLSGNVKAGFANTKYSNSATASENGSGQSIADGSSRFILSGSEDLGGGLKANFQVDTRFRMDDNGAKDTTASQLATGNTFVGLSGNFGTAQVGKMDTHYCLGSDEHGVRATALQASSCALLGYVGSSSVANASRSTNVIRYVSPSFSGLTLQGNYSTSYAGPEGAVGDAGKGKAVHLAANYANGPITAGLSVWDATAEDQTNVWAAPRAKRTGQKATTLAVGYDFGVAKVGLTYDQSTQRAADSGAAFVDTKRTAYSIPVVVPAGNGAFLVTYTKAANSKTAGVTNDNTGATLWSVGYDYDLSKRTKLGVSYAALNNKSAGAYALYTQAALNGTPANVVGQNATQLYAGVRHAF